MYADTIQKLKSHEQRIDQLKDLLKLDEAEKIAESAISAVKGPVDHRPDIGTKALIQRRIDHMRKIRG